jgi:putative cardiolipin synthase
MTPILRLSWRVAVLGLALVAMAGCVGVSILEDYQAVPSQAFDRPQETVLGRAFAAEQSRHAGLSGFRLLQGGAGALMTRAALADLAERSIDLKYFIYEPDETGAFLLERLIAAAERGVRVRVLLDDYALGFEDLALARIVDEHPLIEIRVYNPFPDRARWSRPLQAAFHLDRLGRRMHNKVFAVDGQVAILGGRNIGNHYFEGAAEANFRDLDVLASGPIVRDVARQFDEYWNSPVAVPVSAFVAPYHERAPTQQLADLRRLAFAEHGPHAEYAQRKDVVVGRLLKGDPEMVWAKGTLVAEVPVREAPDPQRPARELSEVSRKLAAERGRAQNEVVMVMAYYVPGERGVEVMSELTRRGVRVRILTNSLASTDVLAVHAGYSPYRAGLLAAGVELHEYRPDAQRPARTGQVMRAGESASALHAKVIVYDRRLIWVGSANSDPRSRRLNTEGGFLIDSAVLAERLLARIEDDLSLQHSWRLSLDGKEGSAEKRIAWSGIRDVVLVRLYEEPGAGFDRRLRAWLYSLVPGLEDLL